MLIAFYPTMKAPDHPVPSGDREMARLLVAALRRGGHEVVLPTRLRSFAKHPDPAKLAELEHGGAAEVARLSNVWAAGGARPDLWFTYHSYYKAPDLIGPEIAAKFGIPYAIAEASHAAKRSLDEWAPWQAHAEKALRAAGSILCLTAGDRAGLQRFGLPAERLVNLPPFIDAPATPPVASRQPGPPRLVTVAMMRADVKRESYRFLAQALALAATVPWQIEIIGDGPARTEIEAEFAGFAPGRVTFQGLVPHDKLHGRLAIADLFVWPGLGEAYGLVYLEAQAAGLPALALNSGGVASTLLDGTTGVLVNEPDAQAYANALISLLHQPGKCQAMGHAAADFIHTQRNLDRAAAIIDSAFTQAGKAGTA